MHRVFSAIFAGIWRNLPHASCAGMSCVMRLPGRSCEQSHGTRYPRHVAASARSVLLISVVVTAAGGLANGEERRCVEVSVGGERAYCETWCRLPDSPGDGEPAGAALQILGRCCDRMPDDLCVHIRLQTEISRDHSFWEWLGEFVRVRRIRVVVSWAPGIRELTAAECGLISQSCERCDGEVFFTPGSVVLRPQTHEYRLPGWPEYRDIRSIDPTVSAGRLPVIAFGPVVSESWIPIDRALGRPKTVWVVPLEGRELEALRDRLGESRQEWSRSIERNGLREEEALRIVIAENHVQIGSATCQLEDAEAVRAACAELNRGRSRVTWWVSGDEGIEVSTTLIDAVLSSGPADATLVSDLVLPDSSLRDRRVVSLKEGLTLRIDGNDQALLDGRGSPLGPWRLRELIAARRQQAVVILQGGKFNPTGHWVEYLASFSGNHQTVVRRTPAGEPYKEMRNSLP